MAIHRAPTIEPESDRSEHDNEGDRNTELVDYIRCERTAGSGQGSKEGLYKRIVARVQYRARPHASVLNQKYVNSSFLLMSKHRLGTEGEGDATWS
jgi:hypothetical protein